MAYNGIIEINDKEFSITTGAKFFDSSLRIAISKADLNDLTDIELLDALRAFQEAADELALIGFANEVYWNSEHLTSDDLLIILNSDFTSELHKEYAAKLLRGEDVNITHPLSSINLKKTKKGEKPGYIYLFKDANHDEHYKIGLSVDPERRLKEIGNASLVYQFPTDDMEAAENELHKLFDNQRTRGEWFFLYEPNIEYITSIKEYKDGNFVINEDSRYYQQT